MTTGIAGNGANLPDIIGSGVANTTVNTNDVVQNSDGTLYRYIGSTPIIVDFSAQPQTPAPSFATDTANWAAIGGTAGLIYQYMGPGTTAAPVSTDLFNTDYTNLDLWKPVLTTQLVPQGLNVTDSNTTAAGVIFVLNDVRSQTQAYVKKVGITAGGTIGISALDQATLTATNDSTVTNEGGSALGAGNEHSYTGDVATNLVQSSAAAYAQSSSLTANGSDIPASGSNPAVAAISIYASNTSTITASNSANTASGGNGKGIVLAFNTLGYQSENFLENALDTLLGSPDFSQSGNGDVSAYAQDSSLDATAGGISVEAIEKATITATTSNATTSLASGFENENSSAVGGLLATNMINAQANAYIHSTSSTQAGGGSLSVIAKDDAEIVATNNQQISSTSVSTPQGLLLSYLGNAVNDYQFTASSGTQTVAPGALVYVGTDKITPTHSVSDGTVTLSTGDTVLAGNGAVYRFDARSIIGGITSATVNLATTNFATSPLFDLNTYEYAVTAKYIAVTTQGSTALSTGDTVLAGDGKIYKYVGATTSAPLNLGATDFSTSNLFQTVNVLDLGAQDYTNTGLWTPLTYSSIANSIPTFNLTASNASADGAIFVLNDVHSTVSATVTGGTVSAAGNLTIDAENNATIDAINTSTVTASGGSPFTPDGSATGFNVTIASNYVLASTIASASSTSLTTSAGGNIDITALGNASIDAEMSASTIANTSTIGIVLAFNTIGVNEPAAGFLEGTVDALFGTNLAGENPDAVEAFATDTSLDAAGGVDVTATDSAQITADVSNSSLAVPQLTSIASGPGISVGATVALNHVASLVEAYVSQTGTSHTVTSGTGDITIASSDSAAVESTVVTPVVKIGVSFTSGASSAIGVSIARNIIDSNVSAYDGGRVIGGTTANPVYDNGLALTASAGNVNITATDTALINATSAAAALALSVAPSGAGGFAGGGAVAINTILGSVVANAQNVALAADAGGANTGNVTVSATDNRHITATVAALSAQASLGGAVAIGAAVALNLIGWNGTVADETQDSKNPILVTGNVSGGSISAGRGVSITATSESQINATTAAVAVAIGISLKGGGNSGKEGQGGGEAANGSEGTVAEGEGGSPTSAEEEGKGATSDGAGGETATAEGEANGTTVDEGADKAGGAETNEAEKGGAAAGESENTAPKEDGAQKGSAASAAKGFGSGGGLLIGLGGVLSSSQSGSSTPAPTYTTASGQSATDPQTLTTGQTVQLDSAYATVKFSVGGNGTTPTSSTVNAGDVVDDSGKLHRYIGSSALTGVNFATGAPAPDFTDATKWAQIGGTSGDTYQYVGPSNAALDLYNQDYTNASLWTDITGGTSSGGSGTSSLPLGLLTGTLGAGLGFLGGGSSPTTPPAKDEAEAGAKNPDEPATSEQPQKEATDESGGAASGTGQKAGQSGAGSQTSRSVSAAGVYTENKIATHVTAAVANTTTITIGSAGLNVAASNTAHITSFDGAASVAADFSAESGESVSIGISIARNTIQDTVAASVENAGQIIGPGAPVSITATENSNIQATSLAAALAITAGGENGLGVAGGASLADNLIGTNTTATLSGATVGASGAGNAVGAVTVTAADTSLIDADVAAVAGTISFAGETGKGVAIGASLAHNRIGDGTDTGGGAVTASITNSTIYSGAIDVAATSQQTITSTVESAAVALSGGGQSNVGVSGAGAIALNEIAVDVSATIDGGSAHNITSHGVTVAAADTSAIHATVLAGSVAGGFGGESSTNVAIGVSFARNAITDPVTAYITNVPQLTTAGGAVSVTADEGGTIAATSAAAAIAIAGGGENGIAVSGGGALAGNFIDATTQAYISGSTLGTSGNHVGAVTVTATDEFGNFGDHRGDCGIGRFWRRTGRRRRDRRFAGLQRDR